MKLSRKNWVYYLIVLPFLYIIPLFFIFTLILPYLFNNLFYFNFLNYKKGKIKNNHNPRTSLFFYLVLQFLVLAFLILICVFYNIFNIYLKNNSILIKQYLIIFNIVLKWLPLFNLGIFLLEYILFYFYEKWKMNLLYHYSKYNDIGALEELYFKTFNIIKKFSLIDNCIEKTNKILNIQNEIKSKNILLNDNLVYLDTKNLNKNTLIIGGSGSGKTNTILTIAKEITRKLKRKIIFIDGKGDNDLINKIKTIDNKSFIWKINGDKEYNPFQGTDEVANADKIANIYDWSNSYFEREGKVYLQILLKNMKNKGIEFNLLNVLKYFNKNELLNLIGTSDKNEYDYDFIDSFEVKDIKGMYSALRLLKEKTQESLGNKNNLKKIYDENNIMLFSLDSLTYPETAPLMGKILVSDIKQLLNLKDQKEQLCIILDEFNVFVNNNVINLINKARGKNASLFLGFQVIDDLEWNKKDLSNIIFGNVNNIIAHKCSDLKTSEYLAKTIGTQTNSKLTKQVNLDNSLFNSQIGSVREVDEFIFHPNTFKNLPVGVANVRLSIGNRYFINTINIKEFKDELNNNNKSDIIKEKEGKND